MTDTSPLPLNKIQIQVLDKVCIITLNTPDRYNAFDPEQYGELDKALQFAAQSDQVVVTVLTGNGRFFSSGQHLSGSKVTLDSLQRDAKITHHLLKTLIEFPKLIIAALQGPALGIACTMATLCDVVYAVDSAWFQTPFMQWAFCPEGCSSFTFPRTMGLSRASEILLLGERIDMTRALQMGLVSQVWPAHEFYEQVMQRAKRAAKQPPKAMQASKKLIRSHLIEKMNMVNDKEMKLLIECMASDESREAVQQFMKRRKANL